jgi:CHASE3 domain sensor protein
MSFKAKITLGFAVTIALMLIVIAYTLTNVISNRDHLKEIKGTDLPSALLQRK